MVAPYLRAPGWVGLARDEPRATGPSELALPNGSAAAAPTDEEVLSSEVRLVCSAARRLQSSPEPRRLRASSTWSGDTKPQEAAWPTSRVQVRPVGRCTWPQPPAAAASSLTEALWRSWRSSSGAVGTFMAPPANSSVDSAVAMTITTTPPTCRPPVDTRPGTFQATNRSHLALGGGQNADHDVVPPLDGAKGAQRLERRSGPRTNRSLVSAEHCPLLGSAAFAGPAAIGSNVELALPNGSSR